MCLFVFILLAFIKRIHVIHSHGYECLPNTKVFRVEKYIEIGIESDLEIEVINLEKGTKVISNYCWHTLHQRDMV
mgnify:CR=1 FL=1